MLETQSTFLLSNFYCRSYLTTFVTFTNGEKMTSIPLIEVIWWHQLHLQKVRRFSLGIDNSAWRHQFPNLFCIFYMCQACGYPPCFHVVCDVRHFSFVWNGKAQKTKKSQVSRWFCPLVYHLFFCKRCITMLICITPLDIAKRISCL